MCACVFLLVAFPPFPSPSSQRCEVGWRAPPTLVPKKQPPWQVRRLVDVLQLLGSQVGRLLFGTCVVKGCVLGRRRGGGPVVRVSGRLVVDHRRLLACRLRLGLLVVGVQRGELRHVRCAHHEAARHAEGEGHDDPRGDQRNGHGDALVLLVPDDQRELQRHDGTDEELDEDGANGLLALLLHEKEDGVDEILDVLRDEHDEPGARDVLVHPQQDQDERDKRDHVRQHRPEHVDDVPLPRHRHPHQPARRVVRCRTQVLSLHQRHHHKNEQRNERHLVAFLVAPVKAMVDVLVHLQRRQQEEHKQTHHVHRHVQHLRDLLALRLLLLVLRLLTGAHDGDEDARHKAPHEREPGPERDQRVHNGPVHVLVHPQRDEDQLDQHGDDQRDERTRDHRRRLQRGSGRLVAAHADHLQPLLAVAVVHLPVVLILQDLVGTLCLLEACLIRLGAATVRVVALRRVVVRALHLVRRRLLRQAQHLVQPRRLRQLRRSRLLALLPHVWSSCCTGFQ
eukprot:Rhum_TRINITY_DN7921_c0_g1::Rhum_TRINITY_DN7921_c0_g1_i1::g.25213::m.25213